MVAPTHPPSDAVTDLSYRSLGRGSVDWSQLPDALQEIVWKIYVAGLRNRMTVRELNLAFTQIEAEAGDKAFLMADERLLGLDKCGTLVGLHKRIETIKQVAAVVHVRSAFSPNKPLSCPSPSHLLCPLAYRLDRRHQSPRLKWSSKSGRSSMRCSSGEYT